VACSCSACGSAAAAATVGVLGLVMLSWSALQAPRDKAAPSAAMLRTDVKVVFTEDEAVLSEIVMD
jgi:hypothetical protein